MSKFKGRHRKVSINGAQLRPILNNNNNNNQTNFICHNKLAFKLVSTTSRNYQPARSVKMAQFHWKTIFSTIILIFIVPSGGQQTNSMLQQYPRPLSMPPNLVNNMPAPSLFHSNVVAAESLPLSRQPYGQASSLADLDNVIESTAATPIQQRQQQPFVASLVSLPLAHQQATTCQLPPTWAGKWHQANKDPIRVTNTEISDKGICRDKKGDKYLFEFTKQTHETCLYCLVINERHLNVLQYKESSCRPVPVQYMNRTTSNHLIIDSDHSLLDSICSDITGDTQLESLFRLDTPSIECPISGKYHLSHDNCREPQASLDSCIDKKQLHFKYSACPDGPNSESKSEVLKCYADWSEGNNYYMIGRLESGSNYQDKGKFRCFVYEKSADGSLIHMAQSFEESCYGLINPQEDGRPMRLTRRQPTSNKCHFPWYIRSQSVNWLSVDNSLIYMFNQNSTKYQVMETKEGNIIEEATCLQQFPATSPQVHPNSMQSQHLQARSNVNQQVAPSAAAAATNRRFPPSSNQFDQIDPSAASMQSSRHNDAVYLVQITKSCYTTDYCVRFYRRTNGIVQIDYFIALPSGGDDQQRCRNAYTPTTPQTQIITSTNLEEQKCPFDGAYTIEAPVESDYTYNPSNIFMCPRQSLLTAQCEQPSQLTIHYKCSLATYKPKNLKCLGSWTTNGLIRLLLADDERQRYSAWYKDYGVPIGIGNDETEVNRQTQALTRSQQILRASSQKTINIVDLQIALITPLPIVSKPMQVRLTRRNHCSDLRNYPSQGSLSFPQLIPNYAPHSASSTANPSSINMFLTNDASYRPLAIMIVSLFISLFFTIKSAPATFSTR